jgi:hypothetical protein
MTTALPHNKSTGWQLQVVTRTRMQRLQMNIVGLGVVMVGWGAA